MSFLEKLESTIKNSIDFVLRHSKTVIFASIVFIFVFGFLSTRLVKQISIEDQLDPEMQSTLELKRSEKLFGKQTSLGFIVPNPNQGDLCILKKLIPSLASKYPEIEDSFDILQIRQAQSLPNEKKLFYFPVLKNPCEQDSEAPISMTGLENSPWSHSLISPKSKDFIAAVTLDFDADQVGLMMTDIENAFPKPILWSGTVAQDFYTDKGMNQSIWQNILIFVIVLGAFRVAFGTWKSCLIFFGTLAIPIVTVYGGMALFGHKMDPLSACLFLMLTIAALEDFVFLSYAQVNFVPTESDPSPFHALGLPCFFTSLTTFIAFGSLILSPMISIRHFGYWASLGSGMEWLAVFLVLPAFAKNFKSISHWMNPERAFFRKISKNWVGKRPSRIMTWGSLLVFVSALYSLYHVRISQTPTEIFPSDHPFQKAMDYVRETRGWVADSHLVFEADVSENRKNEILNAVQKNPLVKDTQRWQQIEDFVSAKIEAPLTRSMIAREIKSTRLSENYLAATGEEEVTVYLKTTETRQVNQLRDQVNSLCPNQECWLAGPFIAYADFSKNFITTLFDSLALSLFLVALVIFYLCYTLNELHHCLKLVVTSFWGPAVLITCIHLCDISINSVTCMVASVLVGLTGDNAVQFLLAKGKGTLEDGIETRGHSSIQCSVIMASCTLSFIISYFDPVRTLGYLLSGGFIFALVGDLWLLQGFLKRAKN